MRALPILILLTSFLTEVHSQSKYTDSIKQVIKLTNDPQAYLDLSEVMINGNKFDSSFSLLQKAMFYVKDKRLEAKIRQSQSYWAYQKGFYSMGQNFAYKSLELALVASDSLSVRRAYKILGDIADAVDMEKKAVDYYHEALKFSANPKGEHGINNNMGITYIRSKDYYKAITIFRDVIHNAGDKDSLQVSIAYNNITDTFIYFNSDSTAKYMNLSLGLYQKLKDSVGMMYIYTSFANYYMQIQRFDKAKSYFSASLVLDKKFGKEDSYWRGQTLPFIYDSLAQIFKNEKKADSLIWAKNKLIEVYKQELAKQKKNAAEFVMTGLEDELNASVAKQKLEKKALFQYYGIALVVFALTIFYFALSGKDRHQKYAPYMSVVIIIILFQFMSILLDPFVSRITNGEPLYSFGFNVLIAIVVIPLEHYLAKVLRSFALDIRLKKVEGN